MSSDASLPREALATAGSPDDSGDDVLLDDWGSFFDDVPADLVFECTIDTLEHAAGIAVYSDRVVLDDPDGAGTRSCTREEVTGWTVTELSADLVAVEIDAEVRACVRIPAAYARAIAIALTSTFGADDRA